jgi:hypothetical protein
LLDRWLDFMEDQALDAGGGGKDGDWDFFVTAAEYSYRQNCTQFDRHRVLKWLRDQDEVTFAVVGPLLLDHAA